LLGAVCRRVAADPVTSKDYASLFKNITYSQGVGHNGMAIGWGERKSAFRKVFLAGNSDKNDKAESYLLFLQFYLCLFHINGKIRQDRGRFEVVMKNSFFIADANNTQNYREKFLAG
jgi:hypothetical protein